MTEQTQTPQNHDHPIPTDRRPLGFWLETIGPRLRQQTADAFRGYGVSRREWRILTTLQREASTEEQLREAMPGRKRPEHPAGAGSGEQHEQTSGADGVADRDGRGPGSGPRGFGRGGFGPQGFGPRGVARGFGPRGFGPGGPFGPHHDHHGHGRGRRDLVEVLDSMAVRGWVDTEAADDGTVTYSLTPAGIRLHDVIHEKVSGVRAAVTEGVSPEDYATTMATLAKIAENLGAEARPLT